MDKMTMDRMQFYAYHGVFPEENKMGQRYYVDIALYLDLRKAGQTDNLQDTINYAQLYDTIKELVTGRTYKLIEALAENIATAVLENYTKIIEVTVKVIKPNPPFDIQFDGVAVEIHRKRA